MKPAEVARRIGNACLLHLKPEHMNEAMDQVAVHLASLPAEQLASLTDEDGIELARAVAAGHAKRHPEQAAPRPPAPLSRPWLR